MIPSLSLRIPCLLEDFYLLPDPCFASDVDLALCFAYTFFK